ncbi:MAG: hypothetical protein RI967_200 [Planctomycetota bacterium]
MKRLLAVLMIAVLALPLVIEAVRSMPATGAAAARPSPPLDGTCATSWVEADRAFEAGEARAARSPEEARGDFVAAAAAYGRAAEAHPSPIVLANLGTAHLRAGDTGRAIAALRAALLLDPASERARANLAEARRGIEGGAPPPEARTVDALRAWWTPFGGDIRSIGWIAWCLGCAAIGLGAIDPEGPFRRARAAGWLLAAFGCISLATVVIDRMAIVSDRTVVLTAAATPRSGNGLGFAPARLAPCPAGTEGRLREERPGWTEVELADGTRGWVESDRVASVAALLRAR